MIIEAYVSFADALMKNSITRGSATAILTESGEEVSYSQLATLVQKFAYLLHRSGVKRGSRVAVDRLSRLQFLIAVLSIARLGASVVVWSNLPRDAELLAHDCIVTMPGIERRNTIHFPLRFENITKEEIAFQHPGYHNGKEVAVVLGTSGSTGYRKYVTVTAEHLAQAIADQLFLLPKALKSPCISVSPKVLYGLMVTLAALSQGACVVWHTEEFPSLLESRITNIIAAPATFRTWLTTLRSSEIKPKKLEYCVTAGSVTSPKLAAEIREKFRCELFIQYGSTELGPAAFGDSRSLSEYPNFAGKLAPWISAWTIDEGGDRLPQGNSGRLVFNLHGPRSVAPYLDIQLVPQPSNNLGPLYYSEDYGAVSEENVLSIECREAERVNLGGYKTNIDAVKNAILDSVAIPLSFEVVNVKSTDGYDALVVFLVSDRDVAAEFIEKLREANIAKINKVVAVNRIPISEFGKVDYPKLREAARAILEAS